MDCDLVGGVTRTDETDGTYHGAGMKDVLIVRTRRRPTAGAGMR